MFKRVFGRRQEQSISPDRLAMLQIDYVGGYFEGLSPTASQEPRALFWAAAFKMLDSHHLVKKGTSLDFTSFPAHVVAQLSYMHTAILGEPAAAAEAMKSLDPAWYMPIRMMKERADSEKERADSKKAAASSANSSEVALVSGQIDLLDVLGDRQGKRFSAVLLDWIKRQPPDPDLWHDIATGADPDGMDDVFEWIVQQPECDAATAASIFHVSNAYDLFAFRDAQSAGMYAPAFRTVATIIERWREGSFPTARFSFEPVNPPEPMETYVEAAERAAAKFGSSPFHVPETLLDVHPGERSRSRYFFNGQMNKTQYLAMLAKQAAR